MSRDNGGTTRSQRISFRPRPIDITKALPIIRTEIDDDESTVSRLVPIIPTGMEAAEEGETHLQDIIQASVRMRHDQLPEIPIPVVTVVTEYDQTPNPKPFNMGNTYILYHDKTEDEWDEICEYDCDEEDEAFVNSINHSAMNSTNYPPSKKHIITLDRFEQIMDRFEKDNYYYGQCDQAKAEQICKGLRPAFIHQIHQYWLGKRKSNLTNNTFIRRLLKPPDREDPSPFKAFRTRELDTNKLKKARKNDAAALVKMKQLREEIEKSRIILEMIKKREKLKKEHLNIVQQLYGKLIELSHLKQVEQDDLVPPTIRSERSSSSSSDHHREHKKKKDRTDRDLNNSNSSSSSSSNGSASNLQSILAQQKNPTGPTFVNIHQPLNGKARQEGFRHFVVKQGEFPTPSLERQYGETHNPSKPIPPIINNKQNNNNNNNNDTDTTSNDITMIGGSGEDQSTQEPEQQIPLSKEDELERDKKKFQLDYFNSISIPTSKDYYENSDFYNTNMVDSEDSTSDDSEGETESDTIKFNQKISMVPPTKPPTNGKGKPIYPSLSQGYIFVNHNYPPVLGRARIGLYGRTYIDFLPYTNANGVINGPLVNNNNNNNRNQMNGGKGKSSSILKNQMNGGKSKPILQQQSQLQQSQQQQQQSFQLHQIQHLQRINQTTDNNNNNTNNNTNDDNNNNIPPIPTINLCSISDLNHDNKSDLIPSDNNNNNNNSSTNNNNNSDNIKEDSDKNTKSLPILDIETNENNNNNEKSDNNNIDLDKNDPTIVDDNNNNNYNNNNNNDSHSNTNGSSDKINDNKYSINNSEDNNNNKEDNNTDNNNNLKRKFQETINNNVNGVPIDISSKNRNKSNPGLLSPNKAAKILDFEGFQLIKNKSDATNIINNTTSATASASATTNTTPKSSNKSSSNKNKTPSSSTSTTTSTASVTSPLNPNSIEKYFTKKVPSSPIV